MLTLPATRLLIPARPTADRLLVRNRLLDVLAQKSRKLTMLIAPAGFGKTTLALDYISASGLWQASQAAAWLSLDLGGIVKWDTRIFVQALTLALKNALPSLDLSEVERELAQLPAESELTEEMTASLIFIISNALTNQPRPLLLTIDDYHLVCDERTVKDAELINNVVNALLVTSPSHVRFLVCSRAYPKLDVLRLAMEDEMVVINKAQLKFTQDEIAAFLRLRGKNEHLAEQVSKESEGWAAAVSLKLQNLELESHVQDQNFGGALVASSRYNTLAEEMLKQIDRTLRRILEACSVLDVGITVHVAARLIACYEAVEAPINESVVETHLRQLDKMGLVERYSSMGQTLDSESNEKEAVFRLHNLLKEYLERNLEINVAQALNLAASECYSAAGDWVLAFEHALKGNNHAIAAQILEERAYEHFKTGRIAEIENLVKRLEEPAMTSHPHLLTVAGMVSYTAGHTDRALAYFHAANRRWGRYEALDRLVYSDELDSVIYNVKWNGPEENDVFRLLNKAETVVCMARLWELTGRQHKGLSALESVRDWLDDFDKITTTEENDRHQYVLALTLRHLGNSYRLRGRLTESITELTRSLNIFSALDDGYNIAACRQNLGAAWRQLGNQARSERYFRQSLEYWERHGSVHQMVITINSLSASYLNEGRYQEAAEILHQALDKARESSQDSHASYLLAGLGDAYCGLGDGAKALSYYAQAATEASRMNNYEILIYAKLGTAKILRRAEETAQAWQATLAALSYAEESTDGDRAAVAVEQGAYQAMFSRIELAQAQLEGALALAQNVEARQTVALAHFWLAYIHYKASRYKTSYDHMKRAINVTQELGFDAFLHEEATGLTDFAGYFQTTAASDMVGTFFARGDNYAADPSTKIELRGFGKGRIFRGGQEVPSVSRKARELIFFLSEQKVPISGDRIAEELWSETILAGSGLGSGFYSTITHARRALGSPETIRAADGAYSLNLRYRYDVEMFEELLNRVERTAEPEGRIDMLKSALELVTDDFLIDTDSNWTQPRREELHRKKLRAMQLLAQTYLSAGDQEHAAEIWLTIYQADMFDERALRCYVELLAEIKSKTVAINFLRRKIDDLSEEGIEAEEATFQLYDRLDTSRTISKRRTGVKKIS